MDGQSGISIGSLRSFRSLDEEADVEDNAQETISRILLDLEKAYYEELELSSLPRIKPSRYHRAPVSYAEHVVQWRRAFPHIRVLGHSSSDAPDTQTQYPPSPYSISAFNTPQPSPARCADAQTQQAHRHQKHHEDLILEASTMPIHQADEVEEVFASHGVIQESHAFDASHAPFSSLVHVPMLTNAFTSAKARHALKVGLPPLTPDECVRYDVIQCVVEHVWLSAADVIEPYVQDCVDFVFRQNIANNDGGVRDENMNSANAAPPKLSVLQINQDLDTAILTAEPIEQGFDRNINIARVRHDLTPRLGPSTSAEPKPFISPSINQARMSPRAQLLLAHDVEAGGRILLGAAVKLDESGLETELESDHPFFRPLTERSRPPTAFVQKDSRFVTSNAYGPPKVSSRPQTSLSSKHKPNFSSTSYGTGSLLKNHVVPARPLQTQHLHLSRPQTTRDRKRPVTGHRPASKHGRQLQPGKKTRQRNSRLPKSMSLKKFPIRGRNGVGTGTRIGTNTTVIIPAYPHQRPTSSRSSFVNLNTNHPTTTVVAKLVSSSYESSFNAGKGMGRNKLEEAHSAANLEHATAEAHNISYANPGHELDMEAAFTSGGILPSVEGRSIASSQSSLNLLHLHLPSNTVNHTTHLTGTSYMEAYASLRTSQRRTGTRASNNTRGGIKSYKNENILFPTLLLDKKGSLSSASYASRRTPYRTIKFPSV